MAQSRAIRLGVDPIRMLDHTLISGTYAGVGASFATPVRILRVQNLTDALLWFSYDGVNEHEALAPNSFLLLDITSNKSNDGGYYIAEDTRVYVKENDTPTEGAVYVTVYYGETD